MIDILPGHRIPPPFRTITRLAMTATPTCPYRDAGYASRRDYLNSLAEEYGAVAATRFALRQGPLS